MWDYFQENKNNFFQGSVLYLFNPALELKTSILGYTKLPKREVLLRCKMDKSNGTGL